MVKIDRDFTSEGDRYAYDFRICNFKNGWAQIDTSQDAWYFGSWANPTERKLVSYCEGDITVTTCETDAEFIEKIRSAAEWNVKNEYGFHIDGMCSEPIIEAFAALGLADLLH